jgi:ATP-dependent helicase/nuclease subunit B
MHDALGRFIAEWRGPFDAAAEARLATLSAEALAEVGAFPDVLAVWSLRLRNIGRWLVGFEAARDAAVAARHAEVEGSLIVIPDAFTLVGRADRIDEMRDGSLAIYDFKTGTPQSEKSVFAGLTPQMTLEAAMARAGAFDGIPAGRSVSALSWLAVGKVGRDEVEIPVAGKQGRLDNDQLSDRARAMLAELATAFADPGQPYLSRARPLMERARYIGDYDHLARVREWALIESEQDIAFMGGGGGGAP